MVYIANTVFLLVNITILASSWLTELMLYFDWLGLMFNYASTDKDTSYTLTAVTIALWNLVSVLLEYLLLISIYKQFPDLSRKDSAEVKTKTARNKLQKLTGSYDGWKYYFQHKIRNAGLGLAFLFMTGKNTGF